MLDDDDLVRITVNQSLSGEDVKNVFFYLIEVLVSGITLIDLMDDFKTIVWQFLQGLQVNDIETVNMVAENLTNGIDVDSLTIGTNGSDGTGGSVQPSYVAAGYRLNVNDKTTRPGGKRISGIGEARVLDNDYVPDGTASVLAQAALAITIPITGTPTGSGDAVPIIVGRDINGALELSRFSRVASVTESSTIRTQTSRRPPVL